MPSLYVSTVQLQNVLCLDFVTAVVVALKRPFVGLGYGHSSPPALGYQSRIKGRPTSFGGGRVTDALSPPPRPPGRASGDLSFVGAVNPSLELARLHNETELRPPT